MQLIRKIQIGLVLVVAFGLLILALPTQTEAGCGGDCSVVECGSKTVCWGTGRNKECWQEPKYCTECGGNGCAPVGCGPGQYECNRSGGCCNIGPVNNCPCGTKPSGVCQSCEPEPPPPPPPPCVPSCSSPLCGQADGCGGSCANTGASSWGAWSACDGTQNTQTRTNACGTVETNNCPRLVGTVYYDSLNNCSGAGWITGGVAVSLDGGPGNALSGTGTFSLLASSASLHSLAVSLPAGFICSTTAGCNTCSRVGVMSPSANNNFYLTNLREAWWQAEGAGVYAGSMAGGVTIRSELPTALTKLILPGSGGTSAALLRASGQADLGAGSISSEGWSAITRYRGQRMDYQYSGARMRVIPRQGNDWLASNLLNDKPSGDVQEFYYQAGNSVVSSPWVVNSGESYIVFIKGNLRVNTNITVASGGFLAFIVKGSVTVDPSVTTLQGLYVMDTNFITESDYVLGSVNDLPLDVQGSIVAWGTLSISRNLGAGNSTIPAEKFTYRPDLLTNMPTRMKMFLTNWQEVVPGTFGD